jgi:CheY-like chemotaxis protein
MQASTKVYENMITMIVDDDPDQVELSAMLVEQLGFSVKRLYSQAEAEEYVAKNKPHLAIIDLMMEKMDSGFILAYKIKKLYPNCPVILLTNVASETGMRFSEDAEVASGWIKADKVLEKGVSTEQLSAVIGQLMETADA